MTGLDLRPLSIGEILDRAFLLYRRHFLLFTGVAAIPQLFVIAFGLLQIFAFGSPLASTIRGGAPVIFPTFTLSRILLAVVGAVITLFAYALAQGGTISAVTELYLGRTASIETSFRRAWSEVATLVGTGILNGLVTFLATLLLVIPGIYVGCRLLVCLPAAFIENRSPRDALSRSWNLTQGFAGRSFLLVLVWVVIVLGIGLLVGIPLSGLMIFKHDFATTRIFLAINQVVNFFVSVVTTPLLLIGTSLYYFDLRVRKEAFDLQFLMDPTSERITRGDENLPSIL